MTRGSHRVGKRMQERLPFRAGDEMMAGASSGQALPCARIICRDVCNHMRSELLYQTSIFNQCMLSITLRFLPVSPTNVLAEDEAPRIQEHIATDLGCWTPEF